ncbi:basic proline-rich protein-like [Iris pallida]|uniref:Basic proline-rich protein-like n=1 Tax=Iris pallida TaxID=29817 RepID=A0AAX6HLT8_IRIPA|nr:basic proline-rich protein-like [Iris pallida]KAJ6842049.1 basic proline-rich protein-like [Iris pallida]
MASVHRGCGHDGGVRHRKLIVQAVVENRCDGGAIRFDSLDPRARQRSEV